VLVLKANQVISLNELHEIEHEGLGERKGEGYGRLLFLDAPLQNIALHKFTKSPTGLTINGAAPLLVRDIESRIVQAQIARIIEEKAAELAKTARLPLPTNSLIGRLRMPLRGATHEAISTLKLWLSGNESERLKRPAMDQMERCKIDDGKNLHTWILHAMDRDMILNWLQVGVLAQRLYLVSEQSAKSRVEEKFEELSVKLIDAVLAYLAIRNKNQEVDHD